MAIISSGEFEQYFRDLYKPLCLFALRFTERLDDAEDIVQQAFADVWDKNINNVLIENLKSYMYQAVRNSFPVAGDSAGRIADYRPVSGYGRRVGRRADV